MDKQVFRTVPISIQLKEGNTVEEIPTRVQLMRTGTFYDKRYGKVQVEKLHFETMIKNFNEQVRGIELMIDYKHDSDAEAAGWIKGLDIVEAQLSEGNPEEGIDPIVESQLWADIDWTPAGAKKLADREFAYLSADFDPNYKDNENPEVSFGHVLLGAALTNRPVIKRMSPAIQLSETESSITNKENLEMDLKIKLSELEDENKKMGDTLEKIDGFMKEVGVSSVEELMKLISDLRSEKESMMEEKMMSENKAQLDVLLSEGKINAAQREQALKLSKDEFKGFLAIAKVGEKVVKLSETGSNETPGDEVEGGDVQDKVMELSEKKMKEDKSLSFREATALVLSENKELAKQYSEI